MNKNCLFGTYVINDSINKVTLEPLSIDSSHFLNFSSLPIQIDSFLFQRTRYNWKKKSSYDTLLIMSNIRKFPELSTDLLNLGKYDEPEILFSKPTLNYFFPLDAISPPWHGLSVAFRLRLHKIFILEGGFFNKSGTTLKINELFIMCYMLKF